MRIFMIVILVLLPFVSGCDDIADEIAMDIIGPFFFLGGGGGKTTSTTTTTTIPAGFELQKCGANEFFNYNRGRCECVDGYFMQNGKCVLESSKECVFDADCSPTGVATSCKDKFTKAVYRCDLRTNKCINGKGVVAEYVDCRVDFGKDAVCQGGSCFSYDPYNPVPK